MGKAGGFIVSYRGRDGNGRRKLLPWIFIKALFYQLKCSKINVKNFTPQLG